MIQQNILSPEKTCQLRDCIAGVLFRHDWELRVGDDGLLQHEGATVHASNAIAGLTVFSVTWPSLTVRVLVQQPQASGDEGYVIVLWATGMRELTEDEEASKFELLMRLGREVLDAD